eukprot:GHVQ01042758.1.p1 GENE.GHVQ01042758.1~~GHVQ01042758.1.p1  ORF type:complete len:321 (+),score=35.48 GHVQ01042758.1:649-1611(+)
MEGSSVVMDVYYHTTWKPCYIHFRHLYGRTWQDRLMQDCSNQGYGGWMRAVIETGSREGIECVFASGDKTQWDNPPAEYGHTNYRLDLSFLPHGYSAPPSLLCEDENKVDKRRVVYTIVSGETKVVEGGRPALVVTDLDGTLLGHDDHLRAFNRHWLQSHVWRGSKLVYNTGRNLKDFLCAAVEHSLHKPDFAVLGVGTEVYSFPYAHDYKIGEPSIQNSHLHLFEDHTIAQFNPTDQDRELLCPAWCSTRYHAHFDREWLFAMKGQFYRPETEKILQEQFPSLRVNGNLYHDPWRVSMSAEATHLYDPTHKTLEVSIIC